MMESKRFLAKAAVFFVAVFFAANQFFAQEQKSKIDQHDVLINSEKIFQIKIGIGAFSAEKRAEEINEKLEVIAENDTINFDSIRVSHADGSAFIRLYNETIMAVTTEDAALENSNAKDLAEVYKTKMINKLKEVRELYSSRNMINSAIYQAVFLALFSLFVWLISILFPVLYRNIKKLEESRIQNFKIRDKEFVKSSTITELILVSAKGLRLIITLLAIYLLITESLQLWPYTKKLDIQPVIKSITLFVFYTIIFVAIIKSVNNLISFLSGKFESWKDKKIITIKFKTIELLSADRAIEFLLLINRVFRFTLQLIILYSYITIVFSLFTFSETWAAILLDYIANPLLTVWRAFVDFLPNLFFIIVLVFVFKYIIRIVKFFFMELSGGNIELSNFHKDWAMPTYKIVRFLILVLAAIVIFPYLPGSNSPFFQGISVFLGILFSIGSSSAIANMVAGIVLTYMRAFKIGDRVKIADTTGDVIEKTLLVTRVRTTKNVDITIPNSMVLSSHIINFSTSSQEKGLVLHTVVTIGYDVPWKKVHELLLAAANETELILKEPQPFVLQTSLDDFYVSYELNAYTKNPNMMQRIYSEIHSRIQDKFNEAGVEIMSPHYSAMRDGNQTTIPQDYLPKEYEAPAFKIFGREIFGKERSEK